MLTSSTTNSRLNSERNKRGLLPAYVPVSGGAAVEFR